ncbi:adenosylcobalamin-dependent ribonucleoside-diphosphate reductase [Robiginitomaculum antarcticum]|uniref:adenosylcobalamin-dependent ribonucleoside-diphosphate reductase n=1 Tax=Robiginitomaculum antarcticum TaxID=437507 RepID=UPI0003705852|nr:adenosylcobalamin-dependent ribonucleoside-diphosphate reductase [Robiginitomaculum antarcticum]
MTFETTLAEEIWDKKYKFKSDSATDGSLEKTFDRVATAIAKAETPSLRKVWVKKFKSALTGFQFIPAGRILAGAGTARKVTLFNCFVMGTVPDDLPGIFEHLREAAITMQQGGGVGMDFSTIRPNGAAVLGVGANASGPLSFMDTWDAMCRTIMSAGQRRGAMMGCLRIDHPNIESFIEAKRDGARFRNFNLSVLVPDAFMAALKTNSDWDLVHNDTVYKTVSAQSLWDKLMQATYDAAEPGVIFVDRVNALNNLAYCETISASNPCGEQMLPPYGACLLGSLNLATLVKTPFEKTACLDEDKLEDLTATAVRFLDNVIDVSRFPLEAQEKEAKSKRRIGLGVTGLADALIFCGIAYGSDEAVKTTEQWMGAIKRAAYRASAGLAKEKGRFSLFETEILERHNLLSLDEETRSLITSHGLRNGCLTSIAPTGTTSLFANNVSSGVEPVFAFSYNRKIKQADGSFHTEAVEDYALSLWKRLKGDAVMPEDVFVSAQTLTPEHHLKMQAAAQRFIDSSISKTVNCPEDISFEDFQGIYSRGFDMGCKGLTTYRPNSITGSILSTTDESTKDKDLKKLTPYLPPRAEKLTGSTYKLKWPPSEHAVYVTINDTEEVDGMRPFEIFVNSKNMEHYPWTLALTRMISAVFRRGGDVSFVAEELKAVFDPQGGAFLDGKYVPSLPAAIGGIVFKHLGLDVDITADPVITEAVNTAKKVGLCPKCSQYALLRKEGCDTCLECGHSKCG